MTESVECKCGGVKARIRRDSFGMCKSPCLLHNRSQMIQLNYKTTKQSSYQGFSSRFLQNQTFFSVYVLFSHFRPRDDTPENCFSKVTQGWSYSQLFVNENPHEC